MFKIRLNGKAMSELTDKWARLHATTTPPPPPKLCNIANFFFYCFLFPQLAGRKKCTVSWFYCNLFISEFLARHIQLQHVSSVIHSTVWNNQHVGNSFKIAPSANETQNSTISRDCECAQFLLASDAHSQMLKICSTFMSFSHASVQTQTKKTKGYISLLINII